MDIFEKTTLLTINETTLAHDVKICLLLKIYYSEFYSLQVSEKSVQYTFALNISTNMRKLQVYNFFPKTNHFLAKTI